MLRIGFALLCMIAFSQAAIGVEYTLDDFMEDEGAGVDIGYTNIDSNSYFKLGLAPNIPLGPVKMGINLNLYLPVGHDETAEGVDWLTLRYLGYDHHKRHGFKWGRLQGITLGNGLLVDRFDSGSGGTSEFTQDKTGFLGYATVFDTKVTAMYTQQNVRALRVERPLFELMGTPLIVGGTYIEDEDGIDNTEAGENVIRASQVGYAGDVSLPIGGEFLTLYTEFAALEDYGEGSSVGLRGSLIDIINYRAEYRMLGKDFVPGYFNNTYQSTSFSFATDALTEDTTGFLASASASFMDGYGKAGIQYELYDDVNVVSGALGWKRVGPTTGVINATKPFNSADDRLVAVADLYYRTGKISDVLIRIKRVYETSDTYTESYSFGVVLKPERLFPGLPF